ncbi:MAG: chorismate synthase, partial [Tepidisphaeraceae bacterium]
VVETRVFGCPPGLGSSMQYDLRLDSRLAMAVMGIQAFKAVEIGLGTQSARLPGSRVHDEISYDPGLRNTPALGFLRRTNNAGGLEGGMTNGQPIIVRGSKKPIPTLGPQMALESVDLKTKETSRAAYERSDVCAVPAASVVMENVVAFEIARAVVDKFGGDSLTEMKANYASYMEMARRL